MSQIVNNNNISKINNWQQLFNELMQGKEINTSCSSLLQKAHILHITRCVYQRKRITEVMPAQVLPGFLPLQGTTSVGITKQT